MERLKQMFNAAANDNAPDIDFELLQAAEAGDLPKIKTLLKQGANIDARHTNEDTPLIIAAREKHDDVVAYLLTRKDKTADVAAQNGVGQTALHVAIKSDAPGIALKLIKAGAPCDAQDQWEATAAFYAAQTDNADVLDALAEAKADLNIPNAKKATPLIQAVKFGHGRATASLLQHGVKLNARDEQGMTAVIHAAGSNSHLLTKVLVMQGADLEIRNVEGFTAADIARNKGYKDIAETLDEALAQRYKPFHSGTDKALTTMKPLSFRNTVRP